MVIKIALIGLGCSGTIIVRQLADKLNQDSQFELLLFEHGQELGTATVYGKLFNTDLFLINMPSYLMSIDISNENEFDNWIKRNNKHEKTYPYVKRNTFGQYLINSLNNALTTLAHKNIKVSLIRQEVIEIIPKGNLNVIKTNGQSFSTQIVILALGNVNKKKVIDNQHYITNPYHQLNEIYSNTLPNTEIGIIGSKLTAVDFAILLNSIRCHKIYLFSTSGLLPKVQEQNRKFTIPHIDIQQCLKHTPSLSNFMKALKCYVRSHNTKKQEYIIFDFINETKIFIDKYWQELPTFQKKLFIEKYKGIWNAYRHPMPKCTSLVIQDMIERTKLLVYKGKAYVNFCNKSTKFIITTQQKRVAVDMVIDATGVTSNLHELNSKLIENLLISGVIRAHEHGGIEVNTNTLTLPNHWNIFVIGQLTQGSLFYTSAVERLTIHADIITSNVLKKAYI